VVEEVGKMRSFFAPLIFVGVLGISDLRFL